MDAPPFRSMIEPGWTTVLEAGLAECVAEAREFSLRRKTAATIGVGVLVCQ